MSYIEENLMPEEEVVHVTRLHPVLVLVPVMASSFFAGLYLVVQDMFFPALGSGLMLLGSLYKMGDRVMVFLTSEYGVTSKRVLGKTGFISRDSLDIVLGKVEAVRLKQSILGRILNYGDVEVTGTGGTEERLRFIPDPLVFRNSIQEQVWKINQDTRSHSESMLEH